MTAERQWIMYIAASPNTNILWIPIPGLTELWCEFQALGLIEYMTISMA